LRVLKIKGLWIKILDCIWHTNPLNLSTFKLPQISHLNIGGLQTGNRTIELALFKQATANDDPAAVR